MQNHDVNFTDLSDLPPSMKLQDISAFHHNTVLQIWLVELSKFVAVVKAGQEFQRYIY